MQDDPRSSAIDRAWDALEAGDPEGALRLARERADTDADDAEWLHLTGCALIDLGRSGESIEPLERALTLDPVNRPARETLAEALLDLCRLAACEDAIDRLLELDATSAHALHLRGRVRELQGRFDEADASFEEAARRDPDGFPRRAFLTSRRFDEAVRAALDALPSPFRDRIRDLPIVVEEAPTPSLLLGPDPLPPDLLGLFVGVPLTEESSSDPTPTPRAIYLFKRNIERACRDTDELLEEVRTTLLHEIGHYLGMDEEDLDDAGYA